MRAGSGDDGGGSVKATRHKFRNFGLNPKTKWKLLISLALILLSSPVLIPWFVPRRTISATARRYSVECAFAFALIRTYINCACACLYLCNFMYAFFSLAL